MNSPQTEGSRDFKGKWGGGGGEQGPPGLEQGFPGGSDGKESACIAGDLVLIPGSGRFPSKRNGHPLPVFLPGKFRGQRSLVGYSTWGHKDLEMTERQMLSLFHC